MEEHVAAIRVPKGGHTRASGVGAGAVVQRDRLDSGFRRGRLAPTSADGSRWHVRVISLVSLVVLWDLAARTGHSIFFPTPAAVAQAAWGLAFNSRHTGAEVLSAALGLEVSGWSFRLGDLPFHVSVTLIRAVIAFVIAMLAGSVVGIVLGRSAALNRLFDSWVVLALNMPALVVAILCYIYFGLNTWALILAVAINKIPLVAVTMREGSAAIEPELMQVARAFRLSRKEVLRRVFLPQLYPYFMASARTGLALVWKIVLVFEVLGFSSGVGFAIQLNWQLASVDRLVAYSISFIGVIMTIEAAILRPLERRATRWRL
jgi:ABC-type nitrate/sulfonate/bicarbonate transport system permease component